MSNLEKVEKLNEITKTGNLNGVIKYLDSNPDLDINLYDEIKDLYTKALLETTPHIFAMIHNQYEIFKFLVSKKPKMQSSHIMWYVERSPKYIYEFVVQDYKNVMAWLDDNIEFWTLNAYPEVSDKLSDFKENLFRYIKLQEIGS